jgi:hypothetical protein
VAHPCGLLQGWVPGCLLGGWRILSTPDLLANGQVYSRAVRGVPLDKSEGHPRRPLLRRLLGDRQARSSAGGHGTTQDTCALTAPSSLSRETPIPTPSGKGWATRPNSRQLKCFTSIASMKAMQDST